MFRILILWLCLTGSILAAPLRVVVSVLPQQTLVQRVGGELVQVAVMVAPGQSPASYEPTPRQVAGLAGADLYVRVGVPFEDVWMARIRAANPRMTVLDARQGLALQHLPAHGHAGEAHGEGQEALDPHVWTSPPLVAQMAGTLAETLARLDPAHAEEYQARARAYQVELADLDRELAVTLAPLKERRFLVFHPSWGYFARRYGLQQIAIEHQGKQPGPRALAAVIDQARAAGIRLILVQPQFSAKSAQRVARAIGGRVAAVDALSPDYAGTLRRLAALLVEADRR